MQRMISIGLTAMRVLAATAAKALESRQCIVNPWTWYRMVCAQVLRIAPYVARPIVDLLLLLQYRALRLNGDVAQLKRNERRRLIVATPA